MAGEMVLLYNCSGPQWSKLRQILVMHVLRMRAVEPEPVRSPPHSAAGGKRRDRRGRGQAFAEPMLVFCGLNTGPC